MIVRWILLVTGACGVRVVLGDHRLVAKSPEGSRQLETRTLARLLKNCLAVA